MTADPDISLEIPSSEEDESLKPIPRDIRDVYILGAGFSRALSTAMPLMSELSVAVSGYGTSAAR